MAFWYMLGSRCLHDQPSGAAWVTESVVEFPRQKYHTHASASHRWEENEHFVTLHGRERAWGSLHIDPSRLHLCLFPFWLNVYLYYITLINLSNKSNYMLSPTSASNISLNTGASGTAETWSIPVSHFGVTSHWFRHQMQSSCTHSTPLKQGIPCTHLSNTSCESWYHGYAECQCGGPQHSSAPSGSRTLGYDFTYVSRSFFRNQVSFTD